MDGNGQSSPAPDAIGIGGTNSEDVVTRVQIGVSRPMQRTGIDPAAVEAFELIRVVIVRGRSEVEGRKVQGNQLVAVGQHKRPVWTGQLLRRNTFIELRGRRENHARR